MDQRAEQTVKGRISKLENSTKEIAYYILLHTEAITVYRKR